MRRTALVALFTFGIFACVFFSSAVAFANGRFPSAGQLASNPAYPDEVILRTTYGVLITKDGGKNWDWICERALGFTGVEDPAVALLDDGSIVAGMFRGVVSSRDSGCSWAKSPEVPEVVVDIAARLGVPKRVVAITNTYRGRGDAGSLYDTGFWETNDGAVTWTKKSTIDPTLILETVEEASDGRVYITAIRGGGTPEKRAVLLVSKDGVSFKELPVPLENKERAPFIAKVDPKNPDRIYLRTSGPEANRLLVSDDGGKTIRAIYTGQTLLGFALSPDSTKVYVGGPSEGLSVASTSDFHFEKRWSKGIQCLAFVKNELWACTPTTAGFVVGASSDDGATFAPKLTLMGMRGPLVCPSGSTMNQCAAEWEGLQGLYGDAKTKSDGGAAPSASASGVTSPNGKSCGCSMPGARAERSGWLCMMFTIPLFLRRIRRRPENETSPRVNRR